MAKSNGGGRASKKRDLTNDPPTCIWKAAKRYSLFLCHYKVEAGIEARYLRDLLRRMLVGGTIFLDSAEQTDLRGLFDDVRAADVLVVLATANVFSRPICLLEIWTAMRANIPVMVMNSTPNWPTCYLPRSLEATGSVRMHI